MHTRAFTGKWRLKEAVRAKSLYTFLTKNDKIVGKWQYERKGDYTSRENKFWESD